MEIKSDLSFSSTLNQSKLTKGGMRLYQILFCYLELTYEESQTFVLENGLKFDINDVCLSEYNHFKWHGYHRETDSSILHYDFKTNGHIIQAFANKPLKGVKSPFFCLNIPIYEDDIHTKEIISLVYSYFGHLKESPHLLNTMIYPGMDMIEFKFTSQSRAPSMLEYASLSNEVVKDMILYCYQPEKVINCAELDKLMYAIDFCIRYDLGHRDDGDRYYPSTLSFGDLRFVITRGAAGKEEEITKLASTFAKYCKDLKHQKDWSHTEFVMYTPEPIFLCTFLASRVKWV